MELFIITAILILLCVAGLGIRIWIKGEFPETEVGHNKNMKNLGLMCAKDEELKLHGESGEACGTCGSCSLVTDCEKANK